MRLNNNKKIGLFHFLSTFAVMLFFGGILAFLLERYLFNVLGWSSILFLIIPTIFLLIFLFSGRQIFEYDSDGEALHFRNRNVFVILGKPLSDEFPKYKMISYEILNAIFIKRLYVTITSKKSNSVILKYDISYLTNKELNDLKFSLSKVVKNNNETQLS